MIDFRMLRTLILLDQEINKNWYTLPQTYCHKPIAMDLELSKETDLIRMLKEFKDVFVWFYKDLKGVDPKVC